MRMPFSDSLPAADTVCTGMLGKVSSGGAPLDSDKFPDAFEHASVGIFRSTPEGRFLRVNPTLARLLGYSAETSMGDMGQKRYVDPRRRSEFARMVEAHGAVMNFESQVYRQGDEVIWISENAWAVCDAQGAVVFHEGFVEDITEQKRREALERRRETASQAQGQFLARLSRELHAPLGSVIGLLDLLGGTELTPQQQDYVRAARLSTETLLGLIDHVPDFSESEAPRAFLKPESRLLRDRNVSAIGPNDPTQWLDTIDALLAAGQVLPAGEAAAIPVPQTACPFHLGSLLNRCLGDADFCSTILQKFTQQAAQQLAALDRALGLRDGAKLAAQAHALKGVAANLSAHDLRVAVAELERLARAGELDQVGPQLEKVRHEVARCERAIPEVATRISSRR